MDDSDSPTPVSSPTAATPGAIKSDTNAALSEAKDVAGQIGNEVAEQGAQIVDEAKEQVAKQAQQLKGMAGEQKDFLADQIGSIADAMEKVADELETNNGSSAHYARLIAGNAEKVSATMRDNDVDALLDMAQDFGRKQPAAFVGVAALLGFAASRFLLASAKRPAPAASAPAADTYANSGPTVAPSQQDGRL